MLIDIKNKIGLEHYSGPDENNTAAKLGVAYTTIQTSGMSRQTYDEIEALAPGILADIKPGKLTALPSPTQAKETLVALEFSKHQVLLGVGVATVAVAFVAFLKWIIDKLSGNGSSGGGGGMSTPAAIDKQHKEFIEGVVKQDAKVNKLLKDTKVGEHIEQIVTRLEDAVTNATFYLLSKAGADKEAMKNEKLLMPAIRRMNFKSEIDAIAFIDKRGVPGILMTPVAQYFEVVGKSIGRSVGHILESHKMVIPPLDAGEHAMAKWRNLIYDTALDSENLIQKSPHGTEILKHLANPVPDANKRVSLWGVVPGHDLRAPLPVDAKILDLVMGTFVANVDDYKSFLNDKDQLLSLLDTLHSEHEKVSEIFESAKSAMSKKDYAIFRERSAALKRNITFTSKLVHISTNIINALGQHTDTHIKNVASATELLEKKKEK